MSKQKTKPTRCHEPTPPITCRCGSTNVTPGEITKTLDHGGTGPTGRFSRVVWRACHCDDCGAAFVSRILVPADDGEE